MSPPRYLDAWITCLRLSELFSRLSGGGGRRRFYKPHPRKKTHDAQLLPCTKTNGQVSNMEHLLNVIYVLCGHKTDWCFGLGITDRETDWQTDGFRKHAILFLGYFLKKGNFPGNLKKYPGIFISSLQKLLNWTPPITPISAQSTLYLAFSKRTMRIVFIVPLLEVKMSCTVESTRVLADFHKTSPMPSSNTLENRIKKF